MEAGRTLDGGRLPIDLEHLSRYTAARPDTTRELLTIFRNQAEKWVSRMSATGNADAWREAAHTLKGAARSIGAWPLAELCEQAEALVPEEQNFAEQVDDSGSDRRELLLRLQAEVERTRLYIDQVIEPMAG